MIRGPEGALRRWGAALRDDRVRRRKLHKRVAVIGFGAGLLIGTLIIRPQPRLVWNASASAPIGLYSVTPGARVSVGDLVIGKLPSSMQKLAAERHYLPIGVPLVKRVEAGPGDIICASDDRILINGLWIVSRRKADARGRPMPTWTGCHILHDRQYLLLMTSVPTSFDGRYFGLTEASDIIGRAHLLWRR